MGQATVIAQEVVEAAIVASARIFGAAVWEVRRGGTSHAAVRARITAVAGLAAAIPGARLTGLGRQFGYYANGRGAIERLHRARRATWWRDDAVDLVAAAVTRATLDAAIAPPKGSRAGGPAPQRLDDARSNERWA